MTEYINQRFFDADYAYQKAIGRDLKNEFAAQQDQAPDPGVSGGIISPERVELPVGTTIIRFANTSNTVLATSGDWWLRWRDYEPLERLADLHKISVRAVVQRKCIVPPEWSTLDFLVQVRVIAPLLAYGGIGRPAVSKTAGEMTGRELDGTPAFQLMIPGLASGDIRREALTVRGYAFLHAASSSRGFINRNPD